MWDILGKATGQPVGRLLGGRYRERVRPYASLLMREPRALAEQLAAVRAQGFRAFKIGWGPFGRAQLRAWTRRIVRAAREAVGAGLAADGGCRRERRLLAAGLQVGACAPRDMLADYGVHWFEEPLPPDNLHDYVLLREHSPVPIAGGEVLTRRQSFTPWLQQRALRHRAARRDEGRRHQRGAAHRLDGGGARRPLHPARLEHRARPGRRPAPRLRVRATPIWSSTSRARRSSTTWWRRRWKLDADGMLAIPTLPDWGSRSTWTRWRSTPASASGGGKARASDLPRRLGMVDATAIVIGIVIGSGIFVLPNLIARTLPSDAAILGVWIVAGVLSFFGALAYAELGAMLPATGGQYVYLREAYGPLCAFVCGWTFMLAVAGGRQRVACGHVLDLCRATSSR